MNISGEDVATATRAVITDEDVQRARRLVGVETANDRRDYLTTATPDAIRNFALSYGDDNPLYIDERYGRRTRWGGQIAPPTMLFALQGRMRGDPVPDEVARATKGLFRGIHSFVGGSRWEWYRPIRPGDRIFAFGGVEGVEDRPSAFAGRSVTQIKRVVKLDQRGEVVGIGRTRVIHTARGEARERGKYSAVEPASYSDDDIAAIDEIYRSERRRGSQTRYVEDVAVGSTLPPMVKGPLTVTDVIVFHAGGFGFQPFGLATGRLASRNRMRIPRFYVKNDQGVPDVSQRVHWDGKWARATGNPNAYDYGAMRECWLQHYLTDWMGDDGWLVSLDDEIRKFNYLGDVQHLSGTVSAVRSAPEGCWVDLALACTNQRGEETVLASARVALPSRTFGPAVVPSVPAGIATRAAKMLERHAELAADTDETDDALP